MNMVLGMNSYGMVFEGESAYGAHLIWPQPVMTLAKFGQVTDEELLPATKNETGHCFFREDFFDPISRIRRGRFYRSTGQTNNWHILPPSNIHLVGSGENADGLIQVSLGNYVPCSLPAENLSQDAQILVVLGSSTASSIWSIIGVEVISSGEELVTLKARQSLGALPDVYWARLPDAHRRDVQEAIEKLADDYRRAVPESVIDRAREAATAILSAYLQNKDVVAAKGKDLGDLVKLLTDDAGKHDQRVLACAAEIPQRLHSRGKHAEKTKRDNLRSIREQDAELAVQCVGVMLCDLRWADWK